jgi:hypothetical protein
MPTKEEPQEFENVTKRLDILISVVLSLMTAEGKPLSLLKQVDLLSSPGSENRTKPLLRNVEIARILGISPNHVGVLMDKLRKKSKRPTKSPKQKKH